MEESKKSRPVKTVIIMMFATVLAKALGLLRETLFASHYGAGNTLAEAFSSAQSIPSSFFDILFSAAILGCFIPVYNSFGKDKDSEADRFACAFLDLVMLLTGVLAVLGIIFADTIISLMTPGLDAETAALAARLLRIMFPLIIFTGSAYTLVGVMQSKDRFILPAFISAISNAGVIIYFLFIDRPLKDAGIYGLAAAYALSWVIQFITLAVPLKKSGFKFRPLFDFRSEQMRAAIKMIPPVMIGSWLLPAGLLTGKFFASSLNGVAVFNYANQSYIMIAGILTYSICNFVFPKLSRMSNDGDGAEFNRTVRTGLISAWALILPFMAALFVLSKEGVCILYLRGAFGPDAAEQTSLALSAISAGMPAFAAIEILNRAFYSQKRTSAPVAAALTGVGVNIVVSAVLVNVFHEIRAVAAANAAGQIAAAAVLIVCAAVKDKKIFGRRFASDIIKIAVGGAICFVLMNLIYRFVGSDPYSAGMLRNVLTVIAVFLPPAAVYALYLKLAKISFGKGD